MITAIHYFEPAGKVACGAKNAPAADIDPSLVTCGACRRTKAFKSATPTVTFRVSAHQVHREAGKYLELGPDKYIDRVENRVKEPTKRAAAFLAIGFLAESRGSTVLMDVTQRWAESLVGAGNAVGLVWSRKHSCNAFQSDIDEWLERRVPITR